MLNRREQQRFVTAGAVNSAAAELFASRGFEQTTIRDIAAASGVSVGTVMAVGDKEALLVSVFDERIRRVHTRRSHNAIPPATHSPVDAIMRQIEPFITMFTSEAALSRKYAAILVAGHHRSVVFSELSTLLIREIAEILAADDFTDDPRASAMATGIYYAYIGLLFTWSSDADDDSDQLRNELRNVVNALVIG